MKAASRKTILLDFYIPVWIKQFKTKKDRVFLKRLETQFFIAFFHLTYLYD